MPFELDNNLNLPFEKTFVYFGRIHPIKNLNQLSTHFVGSELDKKGWKLDIYGIKDDDEYFFKY